MVKETLEILVPVKDDKTVTLKISGKSNDSLFLMEGNDAVESEAPYQIVEGKSYDFKIDDGFYIRDLFGIISVNNFNKSVGTISPNIYVGTLGLDIYQKDETERCGVVKLEVQSIKTDYRRDYKKMLLDITEHCIELIFQHSSPVTQIVEVDYEKDNRTWHQRFAFIKSIIDTEEFKDAVNKVISAPVTKWKECETSEDIRGARRLNSKALRQIASATNRIKLPDTHPLKTERLQSIPSRINISNNTETVDTPENRFVKHALQSFLMFVSDFSSRITDENKTKLEARQIENQLEIILSHSLFKEISNPASILLNSPILQRKEGYREILKVWLMFGLAAKLTWSGGDDIYDIGKRNVATLYEYWLFFELLKITEKVFGIKPDKNLIVDTNDNLGLQLKQGEHFPVKGVCEKYSRKLLVQFSYNRTFSGSNEESNYPNGGSWTRSMRPDYTLSIWPAEISEKVAETEELIVHIHFDAKYKIENIIESLGGVVENLDEEKVEQNKGTYKRADLLKMHSYKDAIRRTGGAYILYPGKEKTTYNRKGFRELIPGLGAFQIRPSENNDNGVKEIEAFLEDVVHHFINRTSQRERIAYRVYDIHKDEPKREDEVRETLPESFGLRRSFLFDETTVLVAYYKQENWDWIIKNALYNARADIDRGSLRLDAGVSGAKYLLLHTKNETVTSKLFKIVEAGPRIFSKQTLILKGYPSEPNQNYYLVYKIEENNEKEFLNKSWDITELAGYKKGRGSALPFSVSLTELMKAINK
jgi:predicted component of viral defense system (DUF524 family)